MSYRLQVLIDPALDKRIRKASGRGRVSKGEWVRRAISRALEAERDPLDALDKLRSLDAPTADIDQMLAEIEAGRK